MSRNPLMPIYSDISLTHFLYQIRYPPVKDYLPYFVKIAQRRQCLALIFSKKTLRPYQNNRLVMRPSPDISGRLRRQAKNAWPPAGGPR